MSGADENRRLARTSGNGSPNTGVLQLARSIETRLFFLTVVAVGLVFVPASFAGGLSSGAAAASFQDAVGENPNGVDITSVRVSNDIAGLLTFRINIPGQPAFTDDMRLRVWFDSDSKRETGLTQDDVAGRDYFILWDRDGVKLFRCGASTCTNGTPQRTLGSSYRGGATLTVNASEIKATRMKFAVEATAGLRYDAATRRFDVSNATFDYAPERTRFWSYTVRLGPSKLLVKSVSTTPVRAQAGKRLSLRLAVARADTGALLSSGQVTCAARIGSKPIRPRSQGFSGGKATCVFAIPPGAGGQTLRGLVSVAFAGRRVTKSFARRIA
jgi:hypothetical protein